MPSCVKAIETRDYARQGPPDEGSQSCCPPFLKSRLVEISTDYVVGDLWARERVVWPKFPSDRDMWHPWVGDAIWSLADKGSRHRAENCFSVPLHTYFLVSQGIGDWISGRQAGSVVIGHSTITDPVGENHWVNRITFK